jgi:VanZ family protein
MALSSRVRPFGLALGWGWAATIVWLSLAPGLPEIDLEQGDKLGHLLSYGVLMFWFCQLYRARGTRLAYALGFVAMGVGLEFVQRTLGYRSYDPFDMFANALGVALGWAAARAIGHRLGAWLTHRLPADRR